MSASEAPHALVATKPLSPLLLNTPARMVPALLVFATLALATADVLGVELLLAEACFASALDLEADACDFDLSALALALKAERESNLTAEACFLDEVAWLALAAAADEWREREAESDALLDLDEAALRADLSLEAALIDFDRLIEEADLSEAALLDWASRATLALADFALRRVSQVGQSDPEENHEM